MNGWAITEFALAPLENLCGPKNQKSHLKSLIDFLFPIMKLFCPINKLITKYMIIVESARAPPKFLKGWTRMSRSEKSSLLAYVLEHNIM